jgi:hypothetical protein
MKRNPANKACKKNRRPALRRLRKEDCEFRANLSYKILSQNKIEKKKKKKENWGGT